MTVGSNLEDSHPVKKLLDEKENIIQSLKKKLQILVVDCP